MNLFAIIFFILFPVLLIAQIEEPDRTNIRPAITGYFINPHYIPLGTLLTDEKSKNLYILRDFDTIPQLFFDYQADYKNYSVSPDGNNIAFKKQEEGINYLLNFNIDSRKLIKIFSSIDYCSNVSFTNQNQIAFSASNIIYVITGKDTLTNKLDDKSIEIEISPDGKEIVFLSEKGKTKVVDIETFKTIENLPSFANSFVWSPDGKKLVFKKDFELQVWDSESKSKYNLGEGTGASWSPDSRYIIFQRNTPIEMKFVNADIYISSFDAKEIYQITTTVNIFEMQPIFISADEILYLTYEDRQIIRAGLRNFKLESQKVLFKVSN